MQQFNNYTIIKQIGEGGMATVYLAEHKTLGHHVAIKVLTKEFIFNQNIRSRFVEEAKKMVRMNHLNVVKVTDLINEENTVAIVMEYVEGKTLAELCNEKKLSNEEIELYLKQMLKALSYIHTQGLIHRDIKPSNFILSKDGHLKLTDFGISKSFLIDNEHTQTGTLMSLGTPMYMSPEQVRSAKEVNHLTDIYSLGVVLWQLASGQKPYNSSTTSTFDLQLKIVQEDLPIIDTHWDEIIQKATRKEEIKRYQSADEFLLAIQKKNVIEKDFESTVISEKVILPKQDDVDVEKNQQEKQSNKRLFAFIPFGILLFLIIFFVFKNIENKKLEDKKQSQLKVLKEKKDKEIEELILQKKLDSLKLIAEAKTKDSLKLVLETEKRNKVKEPNLSNSSFESIRIGNLEVKTKDQGVTNMFAADDLVESLGLGWRLPTKNEMRILYLNRFKIGGFTSQNYWTSSIVMVSDTPHCSAQYAFSFENGQVYLGKTNWDNFGVRAVRSL